MADETEYKPKLQSAKEYVWYLLGTLLFRSEKKGRFGFRNSYGRFAVICLTRILEMDGSGYFDDMQNDAKRKAGHYPLPLVRLKPLHLKLRICRKNLRMRMRYQMRRLASPHFTRKSKRLTPCAIGFHAVSDIAHADRHAVVSACPRSDLFFQSPPMALRSS